MKVFLIGDWIIFTVTVTSASFLCHKWKEQLRQSIESRDKKVESDFTQRFFFDKMTQIGLTSKDRRFCHLSLKLSIVSMRLKHCEWNSWEDFVLYDGRDCAIISSNAMSFTFNRHVISNSDWVWCRLKVWKDVFVVETSVANGQIKFVTVVHVHLCTNSNNRTIEIVLLTAPIHIEERENIESASRFTRKNRTCCTKTCFLFV